MARVVVTPKVAIPKEDKPLVDKHQSIAKEGIPIDKHQSIFNSSMDTRACGNISTRKKYLWTAVWMFPSGQAMARAS